MWFFLLHFAAIAQNQIPMISVSGEAQGTTYHIKYFDKQNRNFKTQTDSILNDFDKSLSLYREDSEISEFNRSHAIRFRSPYFYPVLKKSKEAFEKTNGAFDPTIMPLVEAYGFGPKKTKNAQFQNIDSLLKLVGFGQIEFDSVMVQKAQENVRLDFNGIAQGYSVDLISRFLEQQNIDRYMVEIGGEIVCRGKKNDDKFWVNGIENPLKPGTLYSTVQLSDRAMTTAGNYRNHFEKDGQVFNHLINPKTGSMEQTALLSVTVFAKDAITADAYDTAFFVMGVEETKRFIKKEKDLDVYLIFTGTDGKLNDFASDGIKDFVKKVN
ncbi:FAD:protein FMN transferase [Dyadobacter psychrotolerans]|uniref:FAD:protein FMN transferase n=2 Tax=Dyadobacter psychrotolerans TaxID=2541721 RepID=A0A4R5DVX3_9BACT|nr:FAD:protein FMN transferase [Dyadobacter psychrotolerans]